MSVLTVECLIVSPTSQLCGVRVSSFLMSVLTVECLIISPTVECLICLLLFYECHQRGLCYQGDSILNVNNKVSSNATNLMPTSQLFVMRVNSFLIPLTVIVL